MKDRTRDVLVVAIALMTLAIALQVRTLCGPLSTKPAVATLLLSAAALALFLTVRRVVVRAAAITRARLAAEAESEQPLLPLDSPMPPPMEARIADFQRLGFVPITAVRYLRGGMDCILFRESDSLIAEVCIRPNSRTYVDASILNSRPC
jgi:hypothetical protein